MNIEYSSISESEFKAFLEALKHADEVEYNNEGKDGFVDLYNYWDSIVSNERGGLRRFNEKFQANLAK